MLREPLAEIPLLFFVLLTVYLICRNSSWAYLTASIATMVRYEGAALILAAFVMDLISGKTKKEKIIAFVYSALASVPLALWLLGTFLYTDIASSSDHYLAVFTKRHTQYFIKGAEGRTGIIKHLDILWNVGFKPLFMIDPKSNQEAFETLWSVSKFTALVTFAFGAIYGILKKNRLILILLIFFVPYFLVHAYYPYPIPRYHSTIFWIALLISIFGIKQLGIIANKLSLPDVIIKILQAVILVIILFLITPLGSYLQQLTAICSTVRFLPFVVISAVILIVLLRNFLYKFKYLLSDSAVAAVMIFIILSNQFALCLCWGTAGRILNLNIWQTGMPPMPNLMKKWRYICERRWQYMFRSLLKILSVLFMPRPQRSSWKSSVRKILLMSAGRVEKVSVKTLTATVC